MYTIGYRSTRICWTHKDLDVVFTNKRIMSDYAAMHAKVGTTEQRGPSPYKASVVGIEDVENVNWTACVQKKAEYTLKRLIEKVETEEEHREAWIHMKQVKLAYRECMKEGWADTDASQENKGMFEGRWKLIDCESIRGVGDRAESANVMDDGLPRNWPAIGSRASSVLPRNWGGNGCWATLWASRPGCRRLGRFHRCHRHPRQSGKP